MTVEVGVGGKGVAEDVEVWVGVWGGTEVCVDVSSGCTALAWQAQVNNNTTMNKLRIQSIKHSFHTSSAGGAACP